MKTPLYFALFLLAVVLLDSCASNDHIQFVGHYKPNKDVVKVKDSPSEKSAREIAPLSGKSSDMAMNTDESTPDLTLLKTTTPNSANAISITDRQQQKLEKKIEKKMQRVEKHVAKSESKIQQSNSSVTKKKKPSHGASDSVVLYVILSILLPPLAVGLYEDGLTTHFWISVLLTLLFWIPGVIYALIIILG